MFREYSTSFNIKKTDERSTNTFQENKLSMKDV